jgi:MFS family permease
MKSKKRGKPSKAIFKKPEKKKSKLAGIYSNQLVRSFGFSLISILIPVYLLELGYSLNAVFSYFIVYYLLLFVFSPVSLALARKIGYKYLMILNVFIAAGYFLLLNLLGKAGVSIYLIALIGGIEGAFYWIPLGSFFSRLSSKDKRGSQFGMHIILGQISGFAAPFIGGLAATFLGFSFLIYVSAAIIVLSAIPLFSMENIKPKTKLSFSGIAKLTKTHKKYFLGSIFQNIISEVEFVIWPIFIFITLLKYTSVGFVGTLVSLGMILFTFIMAKISDKNEKKYLLKFGGLLYLFIWVLRIYFDSQIFLFIISVLAGFFMLALEVPFQTITYDKAAEEKDPDEFIVFKEIPNLIARVSIFGLIMLFPNKFLAAFVIAIISCIYLFLFEIEEKRKSAKDRTE